MPSTPVIFAESIGFVYRTRRGAVRDADFFAVGLFASVKSVVRPTERYDYFVTNEHVVRDLSEISVRINAAPTGFKVVSLARSKFETDKDLDLAVAALPPDSALSFRYVLKEHSVSPDLLEPLKLGYGTDLFMVSRIVRHGMRYLERNVSVMRFGNVALIPQCEEKFYFVEMRSVSGHSGSPVFVFSTPLVFGTKRAPEEQFFPLLLGINRGHIEESTEVLRETGGQLVKVPNLRSVTNMAISQVVPAWHIFEMLERKRFKKQRRKADARLEPLAEFRGVRKG